MTRTVAMLAAVMLPPLSGCMSAMMAGHAIPPAAAPPVAASPDAPQTAMQMGPMAVPGTQVAASDTVGGEVLTFTTATGDVGELRRRAHAMAEMHERHHAMGSGMQHMGGGMGHGGAMMGPSGGMGHGSTMMGPSGGTMGGGSIAGGESPGGHQSHAGTMPPSRATVQDVEGGARIVVQPSDPADLDRVRSAVRDEAEHMRQHGCGMMGGM